MALRSSPTPWRGPFDEIYVLSLYMLHNDDKLNHRKFTARATRLPEWGDLGIFGKYTELNYAKCGQKTFCQNISIGRSIFMVVMPTLAATGV
jgi:hypothetical protein